MKGWATGVVVGSWIVVLIEHLPGDTYGSDILWPVFLTLAVWTFLLAAIAERVGQR